MCGQQQLTHTDFAVIRDLGEDKCTYCKHVLKERIKKKEVINFLLIQTMYIHNRVHSLPVCFYIPTLITRINTTVPTLKIINYAPF